ncbi:unnamed protein product [Coffea canephora]|uniref:Uncharacterized protein n=1 Tax=Coffea canephora TaxID=49390 RepID=A0A068UPA3_COFCA|nr:unnamed protein product [Coffea canephora]
MVNVYEQKLWSMKKTSIPHQTKNRGEQRRGDQSGGHWQRKPGSGIRRRCRGQAYLFSRGGSNGQHDDCQHQSLDHTNLSHFLEDVFYFFLAKVAAVVAAIEIQKFAVL